MQIEQVIMGGLLGDSCIAKLDKGAKNHRMHMAHSLSQKCYLEFKFNELIQYATKGGISYSKVINKRYKKGYTEEVRFRTKSDAIFNYYRKLFYPEGKKVIPDIISDLNEEGLAIWFMDDGYRTGNNLKGICFAAHCFTEEDKQKLLNLLTNKFNLKCSLQSEGTIYIWVESVPTLIQLISQFVPECMKYKLYGSCINRMNCKNDGESTCSQASDASEEGSTTTGGIGSLNNQPERPTLSNG